MIKTRSGRVVYQRPLHFFTWPAIARVMRNPHGSVYPDANGAYSALDRDDQWQLLSMYVVWRDILQEIGSKRITPNAIAFALLGANVDLSSRIEKLRRYDLKLAYYDALQELDDLTKMDSTTILVGIAKLFLPAWLNTIIDNAMNALKEVSG